MKHAISDEEESNSNGSSPAKRLRVSSSLPASSPPPLPSDNDYVQNDAGGDQSDDEDMIDDEEEDAKDREKAERLKATQRSTGTVAKSGVITQVVLHNFMCHTFCDIKFGPQINFLVGHNGSGKSAVLTGISMALGGNAKATNRAGKGGGLVKDGQPSATCLVTLSNEGEDAFQSKTYGKTITVERRINKDMGGSYKIKDHKGKTVDTKKATLDAILDHFNIQVDNPMTVLTQDQSRQFLANSSAKDKYNFFLRGTQLAQLTEEYEVIRANTESMEEQLSKKKTVIPELKEAYKRAKARLTEAEAAIGQQGKVAKLKNELAWAYVVEVEEKLAVGVDMIEKHQRKIAKVEAELERFGNMKTAAEEQVSNMEEALQETTGNTAETEAERAQLNTEINDIKKQMKDLSDAERSAHNEVKTLQAQIVGFEKQIKAENDKLERNANRERQPILDQISVLTDEKQKASIETRRALDKMEDIGDTIRELRGELTNVREKIENASKAAGEVKRKMDNLNGAKRDPLNAYHGSMPALVVAIKRERGWEKEPLGPVGTFVKLKDARYAAALDSVFGQTLNAFVVQDQRDKQRLSQLMRQHNVNVPIISRQFDESFDCSSGEPDQDILTIRRALEISNPLIEQVLIVSSAIERAALVVERQQGDTLMKTDPRNVQTCFSANGFRINYTKQGDRLSSTALDAWRGPPRLSADVSGQMNALQAELNTVQQHIQGFQQEKVTIDQRLGNLEREKSAAKEHERSMTRKVDNLNREITALNDKLADEEPSNIGAMEDRKKELEGQLESITAQFAGVPDEKKALAEQIKPLHTRRDEIDTASRQVQKTVKRLSELLEAEAKKRLEANNAIVQYDSKLQNEKAHLVELESQKEACEDIVAERTDQASAICERPVVEKKKGVNKLQQEIDMLERALREREKAQGATLEQIIEQVGVRKRAAEEAIGICNDLARLIGVLEKAYEARINRWTDFRDQISQRAKLQFLSHLSNRGFTGKLQFDHEKGRLNLRVQTDDLANGASQHRQKDAKSLSGGEKSFSTICLLLTMWEAVGCPIRCLDEFDVFMDAVNRRISMQMMISTAKTANATQFILITPQAMGATSWGPEVRVQKMVDPGRNQGTLAFGQ